MKGEEVGLEVYLKKTVLITNDEKVSKSKVEKYKLDKEREYYIRRIWNMPLRAKEREQYTIRIYFEYELKTFQSNSLLRFEKMVIHTIQRRIKLKWANILEILTKNVKFSKESQNSLAPICVLLQQNLWKFDFSRKQ